jgi:hypothetical protein
VDLGGAAGLAPHRRAGSSQVIHDMNVFLAPLPRPGEQHEILAGRGRQQARVRLNRPVRRRGCSQREHLVQTRDAQRTHYRPMMFHDKM